MKKLLIISFLLILSGTTTYAQQQLQLSTYYPAPYGRYQQVVIGESVIIRPLADGDAPVCNADMEGAIYMSQTQGTQLCQSGAWTPVGGFATRKEGDRPIAFIPDPNPAAAGDEPRIGIGTSNPTNSLEISNTTGDASILIAGNNSPLLIESAAIPRIGTTQADDLHFIAGDQTDGDTTRMTITQSGNIGIGTTEPSRRLEVADSMMINNPSTMAEMVFKGPASEYTIGVDPSEENSFKIDLTGNTSDDPYFVITTAGEVIINGTLSVKGPSDPEKAAVKMKYVPDVESPGYYATYAP